MWDGLLMRAFVVLLLRAGVGVNIANHQRLSVLYENLALVGSRFLRVGILESSTSAAMRFSTVSLLAHLLTLLRQSKGFLLPSGQALRAVGLSSYQRAPTATAVLTPVSYTHLTLPTIYSV